MIPAKLTGKPFWDLYLYNDPPIWEAYIACAKYFGIDSVMDGYFPLTFPDEAVDEGWEDYIVFRSAERIVTQAGRRHGERQDGLAGDGERLLRRRSAHAPGAPGQDRPAAPSRNAGSRSRAASQWTRGQKD